MNIKNLLLFILMVGFQLSNIAQPANDDPCNATLLGISTTCNFMTFTTTDATATVGVPGVACANYSGGDVWFRFTMPDNGYHVVLEMEAADITNGGMAVYSGSCSSLTLVACNDDSGIGNMPRLKVDDGCNFANAGATYWVRVWENGNDTIGNFGICAYAEAPDAPIGTSTCGIYPPAGNSCCDAVLLTDLLDGYCGNTGGYTDQPASIPGFCAQIENNSWLAFRAADTNVSVELTASACAIGNGIQAGIFSTADCASFSLLSNCANNLLTTIDTLNASGLTIGNTYYIMIDGWASDTCDYSIRVLNGVEMTNVTVSDDVICSGESITLQANTTGIGPYTYAWSPAGSLNDSTLQNPTASPTTSTNYAVTITDPNGSTAYTASVLVYSGLPGSVVINGDTTFCEGTTSSFTASASEAAGYTWSVSGGVGYVSSGSSVSVDWNAAGQYSICVTPDNECGTGSQVCRTVNVVEPPSISANNPTPVCSPNTIDLSTVMVNNSSTGSGQRTYYTTQSAAMAGTSPMASTIVSTSGTYWIRMEALPTCFDVTSVDITIEDPQITVTDPARTCQPQAIDLSTVIVSEANSISGTRTYFNDSTDAISNNNVLPSSSVGTTGRYFIRYETSNGCYDVAGVEVHVDTVPKVNTIGPIFICDGSSIDLDTISFVDANNSNIVNKQFFDSKLLADINLFPVASTVVLADTFFMRVETAYGCYDVDSVIIVNHPIPTGFISGSTTVCPGDSADITFTFTETGQYSGSYTDGSTVYNFLNLASGDQIRVEVNSNTTYTLMSIVDANGCSGTVTGMPVDLQVYAIPTASISGTTEICEGQSSDLVFTLNGAGPFTIVYTDGTNNKTFSNISSGYIETVSPLVNTNYSLVSVEDANGCNGTVSGVAAITIRDTVKITNFAITCNPAKTAYEVSFQIVGGDPNSYMVTGNTGVLIGNTFTSDLLTNNTPYSFSVGDATSCPSILVSGIHECTCATDAGNMNLAGIEVCEGLSVSATHNGDELLEAGDLLRYAIHTSAADTLGQVFGINSAPTFALQPGMDLNTIYYISAIAGPDNGSGEIDTTHTCIDVSLGTPVRFNQAPIATLSGGGTLCQGDSSQLTINFSAGIAPFNIVYTDGINQYVLNDLNDGDKWFVKPATDQTYSLVSVEDNTAASCIGTTSGSAFIQMVNSPEVNQADIECNATSTEFRVLVQLTGGDPNTVVVSGGTGNYNPTLHTFTSDWMTNGTNYSFSFADGNGCTPTIVSGTHVCNCITNSGTMDLSALFACGSEAVMATYNNDGNEDADDVRAYYLHDQPGTNLGVVMATSSTPVFSYDPIMAYGTTYYISTVVGNNDGSGFPDITPGTDRCLSVSNGQPVTFYPTPTGAISGSTTICQGDTANINLSLTGIAPFTIIYTDGNDTFSVSNIQNGDLLPVVPMVTTTYQIISVEGNDPERCEGVIDPATSEVIVNVIERPQVNNFQVVCNATSTAYQLIFDISGGSSNFYNISGDTILALSAGETFTSSWYVSGSAYQLIIDDGGSCPVVTLSGVEHCLCTPDIQAIITEVQGVSCSGDSDAVLMLGHQNGQAPYQYEWNTGQTDTLITDLSPGMYIVTMTDGNGCKDIDSIRIEDASPITADTLLRGPDCTGRPNGQIQLINVIGGAGQYSYYIDGIFSSTGRIFNGLEANKSYEIKVEDANGCTWVDTLTLDEAEPFTVELGRDTSIRLGDSLLLQLRPSGPIDTFIWEPQQLLPCVSCTEMMVKPQFSTTYRVTIIKAGGICEASDEMRVTVNREVPVYVPNVFTPNGDFKNERFTVYGGSGVERIAILRIFNRWGELIFEGLDFPPGSEDLGWDGRKGVEEMPVGVYVYYAELILSDGTRERVEGDVTLMR